MIDVYVPNGTFSDETLSELLRELTACLLRWTDATDIPIARDNAGAYMHVLPAAFVTTGGEPAYVVRIDVKVPEVVLSTIERRRGFIENANEIVTSMHGDDRAIARTLISISNTADGGWGIDGYGLTNAELDEI